MPGFPEGLMYFGDADPRELAECTTTVLVATPAVDVLFDTTTLDATGGTAVGGWTVAAYPA